MSSTPEVDLWPELHLAAWKDTCETLHLWTQIVGKVRLARTPWLNHSWHVALYLTPRGLTTSPVPYGVRSFRLDFDFIDHLLLVQTRDGRSRQLILAPKSVAEFFSELRAALAELDIEIPIMTMPCEIADCIPFDQDSKHAAYDRDYANRFWRALLSAHILRLRKSAQQFIAHLAFSAKNFSVSVASGAIGSSWSLRGHGMRYPMLLAQTWCR